MAERRSLSQGWGVVTACFFVMFGVWNAHAGFGVFLPVLSGEFGWSRGAISVAASINLIVGGAIASLVGAASDRYGPRLILALSVFWAGTAFFLASTVHALWHFYLVLGGMIGIGMAGIYLVPTTTISRWFVEQRGLALGIVLAGLNLAFVTGAPLAAFLINRVGWRTSYLILGALVWLIAIPASFFTKNPPRQHAAGEELHGDGVTFQEAFNDRRLWLLITSWFLLGFAAMMLSVHLVSYVKDRDVTLESASLALLLLGVGMFVGRILFGTTADRLGTKPTFWLCQAVQIVTLTWILAEPSLMTLDILVLLYGMGAAGSDTTIVKGAVETFGVRAIGAVIGMMSFGWRCGAALGPVVAGFIYDATGSYAIAFSLAAGGLALSFTFFTLGTLTLRHNA